MIIMEQVAKDWGKASLSCVLLHYSFWVHVNYFINNGETNKKIEREVSSITIAYGEYSFLFQ